ncbi:LAMI_0G01904g1_1 [Lachancea mirantina]|uniref:LAMI_0G01904g1_1 n=1 Tax=Lachancea mirantina TaxID=1230905 RepID=A0A1G4K7N0_9SACH|nr:LAMI_0G01904g1_1 [Lachancea mirantina]
MLQDPSIRLRSAIIDGNLLIAKRLLSRFPDYLYDIDPENGWTLLHYASFYGRYLVCVHLIQLGIDNSEIQRTFQNDTAIHLALQNGHEQTTHLLLQHFPQCLDLKGHAGSTPVGVACVTDQYRCLNLLLGLGADLKLRDDEGDTPLHTCLKYGSVNCLRLLVLEGNLVDDTLRNKSHWTPMDVAQTFDIARQFQKALIEVHSHTVPKKPSFQSMMSPQTVFKSTFETTGSPISASSPMGRSFTSQLPPLPKISTSRRTSLGSQTVRSPRTSFPQQNSSGSNPSAPSPTSRLPSKSTTSNTFQSSSSASLNRRESSQSVNSERTRSCGQNETLRHFPTTSTTESINENSAVSLKSGGESSIRHTTRSSGDAGSAKLEPTTGSSREGELQAISGPPENDRRTKISLLNIPISKVR